MTRETKQRLKTLRGLLKEREMKMADLWELNVQITELACVESNYTGLIADWPSPTVLGIAKTRITQAETTRTR